MDYEIASLRSNLELNKVAAKWFNSKSVYLHQLL